MLDYAIRFMWQILMMDKLNKQQKRIVRFSGGVLLGLWGVWWWMTPVLAQVAGNGIQSPAAGDVVAGIVAIQGSAADPNFLRYELAFRRESPPGGDWIVFAESDTPVNNATLALWDTTVGRNANAPVFPDGVYQLRLRVVRQDYNYDEYFVASFTISNDTPTATPTITTTVTIAAAPPANATPLTIPLPETLPETLPSLTPFPSPTLLVTPANVVSLPSDRGQEGESASGGGLLGQIAGIDAARFPRAFWFGARATGLIFAVLGLYLAFRWLLRTARRQVRKLLSR